MLRRLCWRLPIFAAFAPPPSIPMLLAGWCGFVAGCLLDRFCINNKGFSTVRGHRSQQVQKKKERQQRKPTSVRLTVATADPSWVCNGAGGGISGGGGESTNSISLHVCWQRFSFPPSHNSRCGEISTQFYAQRGKIISFEFLKVYFPTAVNGSEPFLPLGF